MDVKHYLDHCSEQNQQVNEHDKTVIHSSKSSGRKDQESASNGIANEKAILEARVQTLKQTITALKAELLEEKTLWRKEVELMSQILSSNERCVESDLILEPEFDIKPIANAPITQTDVLVTSPLIRDYEEKLNRYQGALAQAQAEKRFNIRRQIAANTYRKRLNEVEKLCQEELDKVRETATFLEPLKQIASEWGKTKPHYVEPVKPLAVEKVKKRQSNNVECGGDFLPAKGKQAEEDTDSYEVPVKQIDASLVMDEDASNEIKGKIVLQIGSLPSFGDEYWNVRETGRKKQNGSRGGDDKRELGESSKEIKVSSREQYTGDYVRWEEKKRRRKKMVSRRQ